MHWKLFIFHRITWEKFSYIRLLLLVNFSLPPPKPSSPLLRGGEIFVLVILKLSWLVLLHFLLHHQRERGRRTGAKIEEETEENKNQSRSEIEKVFQWKSLELLLLFFDFAQPLISSVCVSFQNFSHGKFSCLSHQYGCTEIGREVVASRVYFAEFSSQFCSRVEHSEFRVFHSKFPLATLRSCQVLLAVVKIDWIANYEKWQKIAKQKSSPLLWAASDSKKETSFKRKWNLLQLERYIFRKQFYWSSRWTIERVEDDHRIKIIHENIINNYWRLSSLHLTRWVLSETSKAIKDWLLKTTRDKDFPFTI